MFFDLSWKTRYEPRHVVLIFVYAKTKALISCLVTIFAT